MRIHKLSRRALLGAGFALAATAALGVGVVDAFNNHPARLLSGLLASADRNLVVRDGVAGFFCHPYLGTDHLKTMVTGLRAQGYTFVGADAMRTD